MRATPTKHRGRVAGAVLSLLLAGMPRAHAFPDIITLHDVTFSDGGTASGDIVLNVSGFLNTPTSIVTTAGSVLAGATYDLSGPFTKTATTVYLTIPIPLAPHDYEEGLNFVFAHPLGSVEFDPIVAGVSCEYTLYACSGSGFRDVVTGFADIAEPGSMAALGGAVLGLGAVRRRFSRRSA